MLVCAMKGSFWAMGSSEAERKEEREARKVEYVSLAEAVALTAGQNSSGSRIRFG